MTSSTHSDRNPLDLVAIGCLFLFVGFLLKLGLEVNEVALKNATQEAYEVGYKEALEAADCQCP